MDIRFLFSKPKTPALTAADYAVRPFQSLLEMSIHAEWFLHEWLYRALKIKPETLFFQHAEPISQKDILIRKNGL